MSQRPIHKESRLLSPLGRMRKYRPRRWCVRVCLFCPVVVLYFIFDVILLLDYYGAFTPDANEVLSANDLHVKSMQRRDRQSCGAIRANEATRMTRLTQIVRCELSAWGAIRVS